MWRLAPPKCKDADATQVIQRMPAVEVYGVVPSVGQESTDYPFKTLFYESSSYQHFKKVHFDDRIPSTMAGVCRVGPNSSPVMQVMLWNVLFLQ